MVVPGEASLHAILSESAPSASTRAQSAFDILAKKKPMVLRGAGRLGRMIAQRMKTLGISPLAFADNNSRLWGQTLEEIPVFSPEEAARRFGDTAVFVISIWGAGLNHRYEHSAEELRTFGCSEIISFLPLFWKYPETFLPYYCLDLPQNYLHFADRIRETFSLWSDSFSQDEFLRQLHWRISGDFSVLVSPGPEDQYFPPHLFRSLPNEHYVDCGAYDGDTLKPFLKRYGKEFLAYTAIEPDPINVAKLTALRDNLPHSIREKIRIFPKAVADFEGIVSFDSTGGADASLNSSGNIQVSTSRLDSMLEKTPPTILKMDIEGAEYSALRGAAQTIREHRPVLAICVYHRPQDFWELPEYLRSLCSDYRFYLRPHNEEGWDLICYAIPHERGVVA